MILKQHYFPPPRAPAFARERVVRRRLWSNHLLWSTTYNAVPPQRAAVARGASSAVFSCWWLHLSSSSLLTTTTALETREWHTTTSCVLGMHSFPSLKAKLKRMMNYERFCKPETSLYTSSDFIPLLCFLILFPSMQYPVGTCIV